MRLGRSRPPARKHALRRLTRRLLDNPCRADPLRVLRAVRFASRFGFELEESLLEAAADDEVSSG